MMNYSGALGWLMRIGVSAACACSGGSERGEQGGAQGNVASGNGSAGSDLQTSHSDLLDRLTGKGGASSGGPLTSFPPPGGAGGRPPAASDDRPPEGAENGSTAAEVPAPVVAPAGPRESWQGYSFIVPPTMTGQATPDYFVMSAPTDAAAGQGECLILLMPEIPASGELVAQAHDMLSTLVVEAFGATLRNDGNYVLTPPSRGVAGAGWDYALVQDELSTAEGGPSGNHVRLLLVNLGATAAPIVGIEAADHRCLNETYIKNLSWQLMYFGLDFPAFTDRDPTRLARQVFGKWHIWSTNVFSPTDYATYTAELYAANGRYGMSSLMQTFEDYSPTQVLETTTSFYGDGEFAVSGDHLSRFPDGQEGETVLFRVIESANSQSPGGWLSKLYQLQRGVDGNAYESNLTRQRE